MKPFESLPQPLRDNANGKISAAMRLLPSDRRTLVRHSLEQIVIHACNEPGFLTRCGTWAAVYQDGEISLFTEVGT